MLRFALSSLFLILTSLYLNGQQANYFTVENGLSSRHTYGVEQDKTGFIWISNNEGIDRFDGNEFRNYKLSNTSIISTELGYRFNIVLDTSRNIWAYTTSGRIFKYNASSDNFELKYELPSYIKDNPTNPYIYNVYFDASNVMWMGTTMGTYYSLPNNEKNPGIYFYSNNITYSFEQASTGKIWAGTRNGVALMHTNPKERSETSKLQALTANLDVRSLFYDSTTSCLWIGTDKQGLFLYDLPKEQLLDLSHLTPHVPIRKIVNDLSKNILIGLDGAGMYSIDPIGFKGYQKVD
jgi:ligand-binding sensor domain-containing protein